MVNFSDLTGTDAFGAITRLGMALFQPQILGELGGGGGRGEREKWQVIEKFFFLGTRKETTRNVIN